jgi:hypothetical protein
MSVITFVEQLSTVNWHISGDHHLSGHSYSFSSMSTRPKLNFNSGASLKAADKNHILLQTQFLHHIGFNSTARFLIEASSRLPYPPTRAYGRKLLILSAEISDVTAG